MFGFDKPEDGSEERYRERQSAWRSGRPAVYLAPDEADARTFSSATPDPFARELPLGQHYFWWLLHNLVAHPLIGVAPFKSAFDFHDWTSRKLNGL